MKSIITSVSPYLCEKIASGDCKILVKKSAPKEVPFKVFIYCTKMRKKADLITKSENFGWIRCAASSLFNRAEEYDANGKVIGEFICDRIDEYKYVYCDHPEIGYPVGYDCGDNWYDIDDEDLQKACLTEEEFKRYGKENTLYGWHISDLKIYDKPKKLNEFKTPPCEKSEKACGNCKWFVKINTPDVYECECYVEDGRQIISSPRSWQYVEEIETR